MRILFAALLLTRLAAAADAEVTITKGESTAVIRIGDEVAGTYCFGADLPKPYLIAVSAPGAIDLLVQGLGTPPADEFAAGNKVFVAVERAELRPAPGAAASGHAEFGEILEVIAAKNGWLEIKDRGLAIAARDVVPLKAMVTRIVNLQPPAIKDSKHPLYYDHPHHKGVWNSVDEVNGIKFWKEDGRIQTASLEVLETRGTAASMKVLNNWLGTDGTPLLTETAVIRVDAGRLFSYDITFQAREQPVEFEDTKEGMFAIRLPNSMRESVAGGPVVGSDGREGTKALWGRTFPWIDYVGPVDGRLLGVTIMDHPGNPRKSRYHVRDYGLFALNPFGQGSYTKGTDDVQPAEPLHLKPGESVRFRYGLYVHTGDVHEGRVAAAYERFASLP